MELTPLLDQLVQGEISGHDIYNRLKDRPPMAEAALLLAKLPSITNDEDRFWLECIFEKSLPVDASPEARRAFLTVNKAHWLVLLDEARQFDATSPKSKAYPESRIWTVIDYILRLDPAAEGVKNDRFGKPSTGFREIHHLNPNLVLQLAQERGLALLDGETRPPLPHPGMVSQDRREALLQEFSRYSPEVAAVRLREIPLAEAAALEEYLASQATWPESLLLYTSRISFLEISNVADSDRWKAWAGRPVSVNSLRDIVRQGAAEGSERSIQLTLTRWGLLAGWALIVEGNTDPSMPPSHLCFRLEDEEFQKVTHHTLSQFDAYLEEESDAVFADLNAFPRAPDENVPGAQHLYLLWELIEESAKGAVGVPWSSGHFFLQSAPSAWLRNQLQAISRD